MNEVALRRSMPVGWGRKFLWGLGATVAGAVVPTLLLSALLSVAMGIVVGLRLDARAGVPTYLVAIVGGLCLYAGVIRLALKTIDRHTVVPWTVWPGLAAFPIGWLMLATLGDPAGVYEPGIAIPALVGLALAFVTLGTHRRRAVA